MLETVLYQSIKLHIAAAQSIYIYKLRSYF